LIPNTENIRQTQNNFSGVELNQCSGVLLLVREKNSPWESASYLFHSLRFYVQSHLYLVAWWAVFSLPVCLFRSVCKCRDHDMSPVRCRNPRSRDSVRACCSRLHEPSFAILLAVHTFLARHVCYRAMS
jgi:hypothetical protein